MIIKDFQIEKIVNENKGFLPILIYGPNEGLIRDHIRKIKSDYQPRTITYAEKLI